MYPYRYNYMQNSKSRRKKRRIIIIILLIIIIAAAVLGFLWEKGVFVNKKDLKSNSAILFYDDIISDDNNENTENREIFEKPPPVKVKGLYITGWSAGNSDRIAHFVELCDSTEINALVIDIKDDRGQITFLSDIAINSAAATNIIRNPESLVNLLKEHDIYAIARIVCFKDPIWSIENPELAIKDKTGGLWRDTNGNTWLNPYQSGSWDYIINIAKEAAKLGFDEVQFDYVRFPTDGNIKEIDYGIFGDEKSKSEAIGEFLEYAKSELINEKIYISADVFGIIAVSTIDSQTIGQELEIIAQHADSVCPMIYPSHYANKRQNGEGQNINGVLFEIPDKQPYEVIYNTLVLIRERIAYLGNRAAVIRPYLQDFTAAYLGAGYYQNYTAKQIREQIQAVYDAGFEEWILWNASNIYSEDAFR